MKHFTIIILCLVSTLANATFELEDPADPDKQLEMEKKQKSIFKSTGKRYDVIITAGTDIYIPGIEQGACNSWQLDKSEPWTGADNQVRFSTHQTYMGFAMKAIDCNNNGDSLALSLVKTDKGRLIWVETDKLLAAD